MRLENALAFVIRDVYVGTVANLLDYPTAVHTLLYAFGECLRDHHLAHQSQNLLDLPVDNITKLLPIVAENLHVQRCGAILLPQGHYAISLQIKGVAGAMLSDSLVFDFLQPRAL